jgi:serine/threonine protein kinase
VNGQAVVAKIFHTNNVWQWHTGKEGKQIPLEISIMKAKLPGTIQSLEHFEIGKRFILVMEYLGSDWIDLYNYIEQNGQIPESTAITIFRSVVEIIREMHRAGYTHNDIKG